MPYMEYSREEELEVIRRESYEQGIEQGREKVLELIKKGHSPEKAAEIARKM